MKGGFEYEVREKGNGSILTAGPYSWAKTMKHAESQLVYIERD